MPSLPPESKMLLDHLGAQVQQLQAAHDRLRDFAQAEVDKARTELRAEVGEKLRLMNDDIQKLYNRIEEMEKAIIDKQQQSLRRTIAFQAAVLAVLGSGIFGLIELVLHH